MNTHNIGILDVFYAVVLYNLGSEVGHSQTELHIQSTREERESRSASSHMYCYKPLDERKADTLTCNGNQSNNAMRVFYMISIKDLPIYFNFCVFDTGLVEQKKIRSRKLVFVQQKRQTPILMH